MFTNLWLADVLLRVMDPSPPTLVNGEGDEIAFHTVRYAFRPGTTAGMVRERLRTVGTFQEASESFWNWVEAKSALVSAPAKSRGTRRSARSVTGKARTCSVTLGDGAVVLGNVELADDAVSLSANSRSRAERAQALLTPPPWNSFWTCWAARRRAHNDPVASYDFGWMWTELGIADLRR